MALDSMKEIFDRMEQEGKPFWEIVLETDMDERQVTRNQSMAKMLITWQAMSDAADSYTGQRRSVSGLVGGDGMKMRQYNFRGEAMTGGYVSEVIAEALSMAESNACMGRIVAAPTAGSAGVVPGVVLALDEAEKYEGARLRDALACAAAVGFVVSRNATVAGAEGGCQAEVGTASAMAAAAATQLLGGDARSCLAAASIAMGNLLGMVCDPIGGLVEDPCQKRNAAAAENALAAARMALAGVRPSAPFDEVVEAMRRVGAALPAELRETALGGLAACPSCRGCAGR